jgi:hypothetical protein
MSKNKSEFETSMPAGGTKPGGDSNPFTADLKSEFASNFGTNTNAVSQLLKDGSGGNRKRMIYAILGGVVLLAAGLFFVMDSGGESVDEFAAEGEADPVEAPAEEKTADEAADKLALEAGKEGTDAVATTDTSAKAPEVTKDSLVGSVGEPMGGTEVPVVKTPGNAKTRMYDETSGDAEFNWDGSPGGKIYFSRNKSMKPVERQAVVKGNSYVFRDPWPGQWYWQVENGAGKSKVRSFSVDAPVRRNIAIASPAAGGAVAGSGGVVAWSGDQDVSRYKVEFSNGDWANPAHKFQTVGTEVLLNGVTPGTYQMRVGAWSDVSGRWEYTPAVPVTVQ